MISESVVYTVSGFVYAVTLVVLVARLFGIPKRLRRYCYPVLFVVGLGAVANFLQPAGFGEVWLGGQLIADMGFFSNVLAYPILWAISALIAGVSRRMLAIVAGIPFVQVVAFQITSNSGGLVALVSALVVIGGYIVLLFLFRGRIWRATANLSDERRLLHWKSRNLLFFLMGMLIVFAFLSLLGVFSTLVSNVLYKYIDIVIRVGFAGFLFANIDALDESETGDDVTSNDVTGGDDVAAGVGTPTVEPRSD